MLPTEPPLSLHRLLAPVPPARPQETATATRQTPPATAPAPVKPPTAFERLLVAGQNQVGNAAVAGAAAQSAPAVSGPAALLPAPVRKVVQAPASP
ncbi:hypothetical protein AB0J57_02600 [Streptomyces sp. NPDC049837]|uniref:hypothetical protein n=1 Tax=Streptomyces sp. NPDC049837 TaxID=3155277 RepID=UPI0034282811